MRKYLKYFPGLLVISLFVSLAAFLLQTPLDYKTTLSEALLPGFAFTISTAAALAVFFRGQTRENKTRAMYTLAAISLKFLAELFIALIWFLAAKKTSAECILLFFVLYLSFSLYSIGVMLNTLKNRHL
jgi:hypothetical protein